MELRIPLQSAGRFAFHPNGVKDKGPVFKNFHWQSGYGAFSISPSHVDPLVAYIENQEEHHRAESFQEELRRLLTRYELEWDERYVWD